MVKTYLFIIIALVFYSCEKKVYDFKLEKINYLSNELRIDGYYYSSSYNRNIIGVAVFYRNGVCFHTAVTVEGNDTLSYVENEILLNESLITRFRTTPTNIGVFQVNNNLIEFEVWSLDRDVLTFSYYGEILNDTTFFIEKRVLNQGGTVYIEEQMYKFKEFSPKPDSTNTFIK